MRSRRRYAQLEQRMAVAEGRLKRQHVRLRRQKALLDEIQPAAFRAQSLLEILGSQIGAIEERLQALTQKVEMGGDLDATPDEQAEARSLLAEIRDEHRRIRVRFSVVSRYEERVRRLESALAQEMAAAAELASEAAAHGMLADAPTSGAVDLPGGVAGTP